MNITDGRQIENFPEECKNYVFALWCLTATPCKNAIFALREPVFLIC